MGRSYTDIPLFKDVKPEEWGDWHWQLRNRLTTTADFDQVMNLDDAQRADLDACMGKFRVSVTPYYASLIDPDDPHDPVRMQAVPTPAELVIHAEDLKDAVSEDFDYLHEEIRAILAEAHGNGAKLKVIFENCYLSDIQKIRLCEICVELGVDWVKTSTGFGSTGATVKDVTLMVHRCSPNVQVKAAGGIRDLRTALLFRQLGCTRIGCSRTADVLAECAG